MPALMMPTPRSTAAGRRSSPAVWSSRVYLPATMTTSDVRLAHEPGEHRCLVHSRSVAADDALGAQLGQRRRRLLEGFPDVVVRIVDEDEVDAIEAEALEARLDRAEHPVTAEVPDPAMGRGDGEPLRIRLIAGVRGLQPPAHLRGHHELVARVGPQRPAEPSFGQAEAVVGCGVEVAKAGIPGCGTAVIRHVIGDSAEQVADLRAAEPELGQPQAAGQVVDHHPAARSPVACPRPPV